MVAFAGLQQPRTFLYLSLLCSHDFGNVRKGKSEFDTLLVRGHVALTP